MPALLFDRRVSVLVGTPPADFVSLEGAVEIRDLRVEFKCEQDLEKEPNIADVTIYNAAPESRAVLHRKGAKVVLKAGYAEGARVPFALPEFSTFDTVFVGDVLVSVSSREGPDWVTRMQVSDGGRMLKHTRISVSQKGPVDLKKLIKDAAKKLLAREIDLLGAVDGVNAQLQAGFVAHGRAADVLTRLTDTAELEWSVQDGRVQILKRGGVSVRPTVLLSPDTGLVGAVEPGTAKEVEKQGAAVLVVKSLLQPRIRPGCQIQVDSEGVKGLFRAEKVTHEGDTHGGAWYTTSEIVAVMP